MALHDDFRDLADGLRELTGPDGLDVRQSSLSIIVRAWTGGARGQGVPVVREQIDLPPIYKFNRLSTEEVSNSGGRYEMGDIKVGPITPPFVNDDGTKGGFHESQLQPPVQTGVEVVYRVNGQHAGDYNLKELQSHKAFGYFVVLHRMRTTPSVT